MLKLVAVLLSCEATVKYWTLLYHCIFETFKQ
jgi:hypothetical protein